MSRSSRTVALFCLSLLPGAACSSGSSGSGAAPGAQLPSTVTYDLGTPNLAMQVETSEGSFPLILYLAGVLEIATEEYTIRPGPLMELGTGALFGDLDVACTDTVLAMADELPIAGSITTTRRTNNDLITVAVNNSVPGVDLTYDAGGDGIGIVGPVTYTWDDFEDLQDSGLAEEWEEIASFVYSALEFAYERFFLIVEAFIFGFDYEEDFELAGAGTFFIIRDCDFYPAGVLQQGSIYMAWDDVDMNGELGPGDSFLIDIDDCWVDDTTNDYDSWLDGRIRVDDFIDVANPFQTGGTVTFELFRELETENDGLGGFVAGSEVVLEGSAEVLFVE